MERINEDSLTSRVKLLVGIAAIVGVTAISFYQIYDGFRDAITKLQKSDPVSISLCTAQGNSYDYCNSHPGYLRLNENKIVWIPERD